jgi:MerR family mercuric resistance operon transcriptional regulator
MLIGELADTVGLPSQTIRFYERQGLLPQPARQANGYRSYDDTAVSRVQFIRNAQAAGLTLVEIGSIVDLRDHAVRARQAELAALEQELEHLVERSHDLGPADCTDADICHLLTRHGEKGPRHRTADRAVHAARGQAAQTS